MLNIYKKITLGKYLENGKTDLIVFGSRDLKEVTIPNYDKRICSGAFSHCEFIEKIEILNDSEIFHFIY